MSKYIESKEHFYIVTEYGLEIARFYKMEDALGFIENRVINLRCGNSDYLNLGLVITSYTRFNKNGFEFKTIGWEQAND